MIHNIKDILSQMETEFPIDECVLPDEYGEILWGNDYYLCLIEDKDFPNYFQWVVALPYVIDNPTTSHKWGWFTEDGKDYPNFENPSTGFNDKVIGFSKYIE